MGHGSITAAANAEEPAWHDQQRLHRELRLIARRQLRSGGATGWISPRVDASSLVARAWVKLRRSSDWESRAHYFGSAANAMRQVIVSLAREQHARRRRERIAAGLARHADDPREHVEAKLIHAADLAEALGRLAAYSPEWEAVASRRLFAGVSVRIIAEELGVSERTVQRRLHLAMCALARMLDPDTSRGEPTESAPPPGVDR